MIPFPIPSDKMLCWDNNTWTLVNSIIPKNKRKQDTWSNHMAKNGWLKYSQFDCERWGFEVFVYDDYSGTFIIVFEYGAMRWPILVKGIHNLIDIMPKISLFAQTKFLSQIPPSPSQASDSRPNS